MVSVWDCTAGVWAISDEAHCDGAAWDSVPVTVFTLRLERRKETRDGSTREKIERNQAEDHKLEQLEF